MFQLAYLKSNFKKNSDSVEAVKTNYNYDEVILKVSGKITN